MATCLPTAALNAPPVASSRSASPYRSPRNCSAEFRTATPHLHHLGVATHKSRQVLRAADLFGSIRKEHHIECGTGRHGVSNAFYLYLRDPDGHRVEIYTSDYYTGDPDHETYRWNVHDDRRRDFWGNAVIESWYREAAPVLGLDGNPQPVSEAVLDESAVQVGADGLG